MKKRIVNFILIAVVCVFSIGVFTYADQDFFVNDGQSMLPAFLEGVFAIGKDGISLLSSEDAYAISAYGLQPLGADIVSGGGGLRYADHRISIRSESVRVGLNYYYSKSRDSSVSSAVLENVSGGSGFSFGTVSRDGVYTELGSTQLRRVTVKPYGDSGIRITGSVDMDPLFVAESTGRDDYLMVCPISDSGMPITSYGQRKYYGDFGFAVLNDSKLTVVNLVDLEQYTMGVCACEMTESWPLEALKAQAVAARTYAQKMIGSSVYYYSCGFDVTADTYCQAYQGCAGVGKNIEQAVIETENEYLTYHDALIDAMYSAADGGATESNSNVFGSNTHPYLTGTIDPYEAAAGERNPYASWSVTMTPAQLGSKIGIGAVESVTPTCSDTGNVIKLEFVSASGEKATIIRDSCRSVLGLKSINYEISKDASGNFVFTGSGYGHNLGMSQWGAYAMAKYFEKDYQSILGFYYTGVGLSFGELQ